MSIYSYLWSSYSISLQKQPLSNILPNPSTTPCDPPCDPHTTPAQNMGIATLSPQDWRPWIAMGKKPFPGWKNYQGEDWEEWRCLKKRMVKTLIWSVTLYCAEMRTMRKEDITRLEAFEMKVWRRIEISWTQHISNEMLKLVEEERSLLAIIRTRQRKKVAGLDDERGIQQT